MAWKQKVNFDIKKMGTKPGYCLQNVRLGFGIPPYYADAKAAMEANRKAGTLHDISSLPTNVAVPVFLDVTSVYEHVIVADHGVFYSDGKKLLSLDGWKPFGWGEYLNKVQVVEWVSESKKSNEEVAEEVLAGKWGNNPERKQRLEAEGYNYSEVQAIVNKLVNGDTDKPLKVGDRVQPINWVDYRGVVLKRTRDFYYISQIAGDRAVLVADSQNGPVYCAIKLNDLRRF